MIDGSVRDARRRTDVIVIGAGHAGLAMSRCLARAGIEHVILERGEVANTWKTERWDSLRLLTPNWQSRLPDYGYEGDDPDGFRDMAQTIAFIEGYAQRTSPPVHTGTPVSAVRPADGGYELDTPHGGWSCRALVLATGAFNLPSIPAHAAAIGPGVQQVNALLYRNPAQLAPGGVLVVGAAATGVQLAEELARAGRQVTLSVGEHVRVPRLYRGRDIQWWMDAIGLQDQRHDAVDDILRARNVASLQLAGHPDRHTIDLNTLQALGVRCVGRLAGGSDGRLLFSGSLRNVCDLADLKLNRLLRSIDAWIDASGLAGAVEPAQPPAPTVVDASPTLSLDLRRAGIGSVLWATGFRPDHSWLHVPVFDARGRIQHDGGVARAPGLYLMGLPFMRRRKSSLIDGAGDDARELSAHIAQYLAGAHAVPQPATT